MLLVIDAGNTNVKLGLYQGEELIHQWRMATEPSCTIEEYGARLRNLLSLAGIKIEVVEAIVIACVVLPLNRTLRRVAEDYFNVSPIFVDYRTDTGLEILYDSPPDVGADRIVNAFAAREKYGAPCLVVDFGTATKFEAVNERGQYQGGVIAPGLEISINALFERAPRLPRTELKRPPSVIGTSTAGALQSGFYYGHASLVDGIIKRMLDELGAKGRVVATGGLASLIADGSELIEIVDDTLTLEGLRLIYERMMQAKTILP
ncbi:MAG: type III pantothenate kinase [Pyrinomonadaceae bacterium]